MGGKCFPVGVNSGVLGEYGILINLVSTNLFCIPADKGVASAVGSRQGCRQLAISAGSTGFSSRCTVVAIKGDGVGRSGDSKGQLNYCPRSSVASP